jgi:hypothetical protein
MGKKILGAWAPLLAIVALATPGAAQAVPPHWLSNGVPIPEGMPEPVATSGKLTFTIMAPAALFTIKCKVHDQEQISNPFEGGAGGDEITAFVLGPCTSTALCPKKTLTEAVALALPWASHLIAGPPIRDTIEGMAFEVRCSGAAVDVIGGSLSPIVSMKSRLEFDPGAGALEDIGKHPVTVAGKDKLIGPPGDEKITAA